MKPRFRNSIQGILGLSALCLVALVVEAALIKAPTPLRAGPFSDAEAKAQLASGLVVEVLQRQGGWYEIKAGEQQGWVRMSSVHLGNGESGGTDGVGDALGFLQSGRATATEATPSTGVRGLDEPQLAQAEPDPAAVSKLDQFATNDLDARRFAAQASLASTSVQDLPGAAQ